MCREIFGEVGNALEIGAGIRLEETHHAHRPATNALWLRLAAWLPIYQPSRACTSSRDCRSAYQHSRPTGPLALKYSAFAGNTTGRGTISGKYTESMIDRWLEARMAGPACGMCSRPENARAPHRAQERPSDDTGKLGTARGTLRLTLGFSPADLSWRYKIACPGSAGRNSSLGQPGPVSRRRCSGSRFGPVAIWPGRTACRSRRGCWSHPGWWSRRGSRSHPGWRSRRGSRSHRVRSRRVPHRRQLHLAKRYRSGRPQLLRTTCPQRQARPGGR